MTCMRRAAWPCTAPPWWHNVCDEHRDVATASLLENWIDESERRTYLLCAVLALAASLIETWIDETERRVWFLFEAGQREMTGGH